MKVLCLVNHYFGQPLGFEGRSTDRDAEGRRAIVAATLAGLRAIPGADVRVCGIEGRSLEPIQVDLSEARNDPKLLIYASLAYMAEHVDAYDYFINVEDDILVPVETFENVLTFDRTSLVNEVLHPNRIERGEDGLPFCVDMSAMPGWTHHRRRYGKRELRVAINPHSAILILSQEKLRYALAHTDRAYRGRFLVWEMDSAFAYYNSPFALLRPYDDLEFHTVTHLDPWAGPRRAPKPVVKAARPRSGWKSIAREFVPPILLHNRRKRPTDPPA